LGAKKRLYKGRIRELQGLAGCGLAMAGLDDIPLTLKYIFMIDHQ
jgi:hypothetical protein